jgi:hypothetical protein
VTLTPPEIASTNRHGRKADIEKYGDNPFYNKIFWHRRPLKCANVPRVGYRLAGNDAAAAAIWDDSLDEELIDFDLSP